VLGGGGAGVALDRVQRPPDTARALQQTHILTEHMNGGVPGPGPFVDRPVDPHEPARQQLLCAITVFSTAPPRPCHRWQRSLTCTA